MPQVVDRVSLRGYRVGELPLPIVKAVDDTVNITKTKTWYVDGDRPIVAVSCGMHVEGVAPLRCCQKDPETAQMGALKRVGTRLPTPSKCRLRRLRRFVNRWLKKHPELVLPAETDVSFDTWIEKTPYPEWRKVQLREIFAAHPILGKKDFVNKCFVKDEYYTEPKHARAIYSRSDAFKCHVGPWFKAIEEVLYLLPEFIKHVPVADRPAYITARLYRTGARYFATDYSSFESHFKKWMMEHVEFQLYEHCTKNIPGSQAFMNLVRNVIGGLNICEFKYFVFYIEGTRMSGEMNTSLGNGFSNLMFMLFMCDEKGVIGVVMVVEGDDGLGTGIGEFPTVDDFADLGLSLKMEWHEDLSTASFCGIIFDMEDQVNIRDPRGVIADIAFVCAKYRKAREPKLLGLMKCKALSLLHGFRGCPVLQALAQMVLRLTQRIEVRHLVHGGAFDEFARRQILEVLGKGGKPVARPVPDRTRMLMEVKFGISMQFQKVLESYFDSVTTVAPLRIPCSDMLFPESWFEYYRKYSTGVYHGTDLIDRARVFPYLEIGGNTSIDSLVSSGVLKDQTDAAVTTRRRYRTIHKRCDVY